MLTETVTVAFVNPPKKNPKFGSIKTVAGDYISVPATQLAQFQPNGTYNINYKLDDSGQYKNFVSMVGASPGNAKATANSHTKSVEMAVMGIVGRAVQGAGTVPDEETLTIWMQAVAHSWRTTFGD